jgi:hypothetical protein
MMGRKTKDKKRSNNKIYKTEAKDEVKVMKRRWRQRRSSIRRYMIKRVKRDIRREICGNYVSLFIIIEKTTFYLRLGIDELIRSQC